MSNNCVACGVEIPEGMQVCAACECAVAKKREVKNKLERIRAIECEIRSVSDEVSVAYSRCVSSTNYSAIRISGSCSKDLETLYESVAVKKDKLISLMNEKENLAAWFDDAAKPLDGTARAILRDRFVNGYTLERLSRIYHYSSRHAVEKVLNSIYLKVDNI